MKRRRLLEETVLGRAFNAVHRAADKRGSTVGGWLLAILAFVLLEAMELRIIEGR